MLVSRLLKVALLGSEWVMWLLLGLSVISFAFMAERLLFFVQRRGDTDGAEKLLVESRTIEAQVLLGALHWVQSGAEAFTDAVESQLGKRKKDLERGLGFLGTLGSNAPFIGLFGTVIGVIGAFTQLSKGASSGAGKAAMDNVIGLIGESLVATGVGLFVAIPAVVGYNLVQARIASIETNVGAITKQICAILKSTPRDRTSAPRELEAAE